MSDVTYLKINLYLRMFHPLSTTGLIPVLVLLILNIRITRGIIKLQVSRFLPEVGKNERELSSFQFIHERGSYLAHIFTKF